MAIDISHYHGWYGKLGSPWTAVTAMVRVAMLQLFRRKLYWVVLALGLAQFLTYWSVIYAVTQMQLPPEAREGLLARFGFSAQAEIQDSGYIQFMHQQNNVVMLLLAFSGSLLVGSDFQQRALPFYLSRRIDRRHYITGKLLAIGVIVLGLTSLPASLLFMEYGMFTSSLSYWVENWRVFLGIWLYGLILALVNGVLLASLAAKLRRAAPIAILWVSMFLLPGRLGGILRNETGNDAWRLLDLWRDMRTTGELCFGVLEHPSDRWAPVILAGICSTALVVLIRQVHAVEIVE